MRVLLDTDVLLDILQARAPHFPASAALLDWAEQHPGKAAVAWHSCANLHYLSKGRARPFLTALLCFAEIPATGTEQMMRALTLKIGDFEDAMQATAALTFGAQWIATRNVRDYAGSPVKAITPEKLLPLLGLRLE